MRVFDFFVLLKFGDSYFLFLCNKVSDQVFKNQTIFIFLPQINKINENYKCTYANGRKESTGQKTF